MLFKVRAPALQKEDSAQNKMSVAQMLAFRDTWIDPLYQGFSIERLLSAAKSEKQKKKEVPKLVLSDHGFHVRDKTTMDESELELRRVQSVLNKLTEQNFDVLSQEMLSHDLICNATILPGVVKIVFNKAVSEPVFSALYARLCARIANYERELVNESKNNLRILERLQSAQKQLMRDSYMPPLGDFVRFVLVSHCQKIYDEFRCQVAPKDAETAEQLRKQNMSNIKFIGELYVKSLMTTRVIVSIASYALALGMEPGVTKTNVSDVDLEIAYNLFNVIGKKFDEMPKNIYAEVVWGALQKCADDNGFPKRIRFLVQNLLDWRKTGWKTKDVTPVVSSSANTEAPSVNNNNSNNPHTCNEGQNNKTMHRVASTNNQQDYHHHHHHVGNSNQAQYQYSKAQDRANSHADSTPPAEDSTGRPISQSWISSQGGEKPPEADTASTNKEDNKFLSLAHPPKSLSPEIEKQIYSLTRDAIAGQDWMYAENTLRELIPGEGKAVNMTSAAFALVKTATLCSNEDERKMFTKALQNNIFASVVSKAYSWFLADAILKNIKEDVPRVFSRFVSIVIATPSLGFLVVVRDIMARTANYLDVLFTSVDSVGEDCEEDFIEVWSNLVSAWRQERADDPELKDPIRILNCIASLKQGSFMRDIASDFLMELMGAGIITDDAISEWTAGRGESEKYSLFYEQITQLFPGLE